MDLDNITYQGSDFVKDSKIIDHLPENLISLLQQINGFVQYGGGLHVRGVVVEPEWHSIEILFNGELALHKAYSLIKETDIPFAEDCVGDQFLLRKSNVIKLFSETGEVERLGYGLATFFKNISKNPIKFLGMEPLLQLNNEVFFLEPGQLISVYPPFCTKEAENGVTLKAVPSNEVLCFLANFSKTIADFKDGDSFSINVVE